jgi:hypothetical protein
MVSWARHGHLTQADLRSSDAAVSPARVSAATPVTAPGTLSDAIRDISPCSMLFAPRHVAAGALERDCHISKSSEIKAFCDQDRI